MDDTESLRRQARATWSAGDWDSFAGLIGPVGDVVIDRVGVAPGLRLLDVGTGNGGNLAIPAAQCIEAVDACARRSVAGIRPRPLAEVTGEAGGGLVIGALLALALPKLSASTVSHPVVALEEVLEEAGEPQVAFEG